jgi:hypothetical protein
MKKLVIVLGIVVAMAGFMAGDMFLCLPTAQAGAVLNIGDQFTLAAPLYNSVGWDGGPFTLADLTTGVSFTTFCASTSLYFVPNTTYTISGFQSVGATQTNPVNSFAAAALYSNFMAGNIQLSTSNQQIAFQEAIWYLIGDPQWTSIVSSQEQTYVSQGLGYNWTSDGNVEQIVYNGYTNPGQPQLVIAPSPTPEPCSLLLVSSGLAAWAACRRFKKKYRREGAMG